MKIENFFKISLIISTAGILLLLLLANILEPESIEISKITERMLNKKVKINGIISNIKDKETFKILSVSDSSGDIDVLCECKDNTKMNLQVEVTGKIQDYNGNLQIQADKIIKQ